MIQKPDKVLSFMIALLFALIIHSCVLSLTGCTSVQEHRQELLQQQYPDCEVQEDLVVICPELPDVD
jgi:hypothetical protein